MNELSECLRHPEARVRSIATSKTLSTSLRIAESQPEWISGTTVHFHLFAGELLSAAQFRLRMQQY